MADARSENARRIGKLYGGRPKGSTTRPVLRDYITRQEIIDLVNTAKTQAKDKPEILKFVLEHIFGKAPQVIDANLAGQIELFISKEVADKYDFTSSTSGDSQRSA